jgi:hypothetical protein
LFEYIYVFYWYLVLCLFCLLCIAWIIPISSVLYPINILKLKLFNIAYSFICAVDFVFTFHRTAKPRYYNLAWVSLNLILLKKNGAFILLLLKTSIANHRGIGEWHIYLNNIYKNKIYYMFCKRVRLLIFLHLMTKVEISLVLFKILSLQ